MSLEYLAKDIPFLTILFDISPAYAYNHTVIPNRDQSKRNPPMKHLRISGETFDVSTPYGPGHGINEIEAKVLNQTRSENIGNNLRAEIQKMQEAQASKTDMQALVSKYDQEYNFSMGGATREPVDPLEREAYRVAREAVKDALSSAGKKLKEVDKQWLEDKIAEVAAQEDALAEAKKRLKAREKKVKISTDALGLGA